jgi:type II secretory pathway pseudopilin PulG
VETPFRRPRGATLFEFAVAAIIIAILGAVLLDRVLRYQAEAEEVRVGYQVAIMRSALLSRVAEAGIASDPRMLAALVGLNPVTLLQSEPPGYRGEFDHPEAGTSTENNGFLSICTATKKHSST